MGVVELHGGRRRERAVRDVESPHVCADACAVHLTHVCAELQSHIEPHIRSECVPYALTECFSHLHAEQQPVGVAVDLAQRVTISANLGPFGLADKLPFFIANVVPISKPFIFSDRVSNGTDVVAKCISNCLPEYFTFRKSLMGSHGSNVPKRGEGRW